MKYLLDTHVLIWLGDVTASRVTEPLREIVMNPTSLVFFSPVSIWEVAIKCGLGRTDFGVDPNELRRQALWSGYLELAINGNHAAGVAMLPEIHRDPFDRLLVSQSIIEDAVLLTHDAMIAKYPGPIQLI